MSFKREKTKDYFLLDTNVENMFINEYMVSAPEGYVKVYLFALMYTNLGVEFDNGDIAKQLMMEEEDVLKAWTYWEKMGVIRKIRKASDNSLDYDVEFVLLKNMLYGTHEETQQFSSEQGINAQMANQEYKDMFARIEKALGRVISGSEMGEVLSWINDFGTDPEVVGFAFEYCAKRNKKAVRYVGAVIRNWITDGLRTMEEVSAHLEQVEGRNVDYKRVFQALGFKRNPTEEETRIMDTWFDGMGFRMETVLDACAKTSGISSPSINYVNRILENWYAENGSNAKADGITNSDRMKYYDYLREREEREAGERKEEVYSKVPRIREIDEEEQRLASSLSRIAVSNRVDKREATEEIKEKIDRISTEKAFLLTDNGFELDYMDMKYQCPLCRDTGMLDTGERCQCFREITEEKISLITKA
ncbi:MAG: DnaD domain protein [Clostridia bacterium]|nr:DnaD domain protein [Clostridia bacterium]